MMSGGNGLSGLEKFGIAVGIAGIVGAVAGVIAILPKGGSDSTSSPVTTITTRNAPAPTATTLPPVGAGSDGGYRNGAEGDYPVGGVPGNVITQTQAPPVQTAAAPQSAILSVAVTPRTGNGLLTKVGQDTYELVSYPSSINPPLMTFDWASQGPGGKVGSGGCTVNAQIDGPGSNYPQYRRSSDCSGSPNSRLEVYDPGSYTVTVAVTPPDGGSPVSGSASFTLVPHGG